MFDKGRFSLLLSVPKIFTLRNSQHVLTQTVCFAFKLKFWLNKEYNCKCLINLYVLISAKLKCSFCFFCCYSYHLRSMLAYHCIYTSFVRWHKIIIINSNNLKLASSLIYCLIETKITQVASEMHNTLTEDRGQSLFTTSTHTGHHWRDGYYFPSSNFQVRTAQKIKTF
jgi:hypothetical protein